ncbi:autotransporter domain-containing protein [Helicobacter cappadocius]|uniref:Autotransporter domain-containing protein n=1 Tax=Helicobacter cappadocius TaxID=3063998 RepID=A0AA90PKQ5_9HELI|nr:MULTISPECIES: autotransporter domain-containing protein [unclassified Helicobacter]MDO7253912.1 autotransporter domain-containing protein [Helicobacter sp. faydin-H75]MDP2539791.1 autotransporter domain-containing protein [Helicobacter sp. faydin-H76]
MNDRILIVILMFIAINFPLYGADVVTYDKNTDLNFDTPIVPNGILPRKNISIQNNAIVNINFSPPSNSKDDWFTAAFFSSNSKKYTFSGDGELNFFYDGSRVSGSQFELFAYREMAGNGNIIFDVNTSVKVADNSNIARGVFVQNGSDLGAPKGSYVFNKNLIVDVNNAAPTSSPNFLRTIFYTEDGGAQGDIYVNADTTTHQTLNPDNIIQLKGDVKFGAGTIFYMNLTNPDSFWMGKTLDSGSDSHLYLSNGGKWYLTSNSRINTITMDNPSLDESTNLDSKTQRDFSIVNLMKYASSNVAGVYCANDNCPRDYAGFSPRILKVENVNGENGVFALMTDIASAKSDKIEVGNLNSVNYIQIYQNPKQIILDASGKNIAVASAKTVADGADFKGIATIIGLYDYTPVLQKKDGGASTQWILGSIDRTPSQTARTLLDVLSLPYQIFRLEGDSAHSRLEDFFYPPTLNGLWAKVYGGGIYEKQPFGDKTTQNLFYNFQGGYDKGETFEEKRYFYGGSLDYTKMYAGDKGFDGYSNSIGFGAYGGYIDQKGWVIDANAKYIYSGIHTNIYQAQSPVKFGNNILLLSAKVGYNFYPFYLVRTKTVERCVQKIFCRNAIEKTKVRDESIYIQPYFSFTPGLIFGNTLKFQDNQSHSNIKAHLHFSPALITKIGLGVLKRYDYLYSSLNLRGHIEYSNDINLGGNVTLIDDANVPLYGNSKKIDNRLGFGGGVDWMFFNDSLKLHLDFKSEFFGQINTYWVLSAGIRYKFGQKPPKTYKSLNLRPMPPKPQKVAPINYLTPYKEKEESKDKTFYENNHFKSYGGEKKQIMQTKQKEQKQIEEEKKRKEARKYSPPAWQSTRPMPKIPKQK